MNSILLQTFLLLMYGFMGYNLFPIVRGFIYARQKNNDLKDATPQPVDDKRLCKNIHSWSTTEMFLPSAKKVSLMRYCRSCGLVPELNKMISQNSLEQVEVYERDKAIDARTFEEFIKVEEAKIKDLFKDDLAKGMNGEKLIVLFEMGGSHVQRYKAFYKQRHAEILADKEKSNA